MKNYIKPEVKVYKVRIESLLAAESGQMDEGFAKKHNYSLFNEENGGWQPKDVSLWDDEDCDE